jgi:hypothetical protein
VIFLLVCEEKPALPYRQELMVAQSLPPIHISHRLGAISRVKDSFLAGEAGFSLSYSDLGTKKIIVSTRFSFVTFSGE